MSYNSGNAESQRDSAVELRNNATRTRGRPFARGNTGRPKGARHKTTMMLERIMADEAREVVKAVIAEAKAGDMQAARLILDRVLPPRKGRPVTFNLPEVWCAEDVLGALAQTVAAMAAGELTPDEAATVAGVLEVKRKAIETVDLERRLSALERNERVPEAGP